MGYDSSDFIIINEGRLSWVRNFAHGASSGIQVVHQLITGLNEELEAFRLQEMAGRPERLLITGGGSELAGLPEGLEEGLGLPVEIGYPMLKDERGVPQTLAPQYSMAAGLAWERFVDELPG
ncbi:hypothetical protein N752_13245 [Desulforamulus aquiferis]|nr:hypothetical protein [Desulforamulus aquiferis]RYD04333.1 hypothetical protein N752_13245 [Desulforamulus aquiferis]